MESMGSMEAADSFESHSSDGQCPAAIVGIGASAGGLEALETFFDNTPLVTGLAFVVVQHLSPDSKSLKNELLSRHTQMRIQRVTDGMRVEPNAVYLLPPNKEMIASGGRLFLTDKDQSQSLTLPIDVFFRSLAQDAGDRAVGIVLSGVGSDGSRGIRAIHEAGGLVLVQDPFTATFDGMPKSAIDTGIVDYTLAPNAMPGAILAHLVRAGSSAMLPQSHAAAVSEEGLNALFRILHDECGIDFSPDERSMVSQRLEHRLHRQEQMDVGQASLDQMQSLEIELRYTKENLQTTIEELEARNEELQAKNEELVASNEQLQSTVDTLKRTERDLNLMSKVFKDGADAIIIEDLSGVIIHVNDETERAYGWSREELLGNAVDRLLPEAEREKAVESRRRCRNSQPVRNVETTRLRKSGELCPILLTLSLLTDETGEPLAIASTAKDITARKHAELQCREAVERRDQFLAMLSHELRNPLGAVLNASYVLDQNCHFKGDCHKPCKVIERQTHLMARLLDDLLDVSRVMQGKIDIRMEPCDLRRAVEAAIEVVGPQIDGRDQELHVDMESTPLIVNGDLSRLQQIQVNLLTNAMKYTPASGKIWLSARQDRDHIVLRVRDTGEGIPPDMLHGIFDLFVQAGGTLDRSDGGMGVGLTLVKKLVDIHGGSIEALSDGLGTGSEFVVRLPACADAESTRSGGHRANPMHQGKILVVEDNVDSREMLRSLLELYGYQVEAAGDGRKGLEMLQQGTFDIALVDIGLPGLDGYQIARTIRKDPKHSAVRLVALTGYGRPGDRLAVKEAGFDEHLVKPLDRNELTRVLEQGSG